MSSVVRHNCYKHEIKQIIIKDNIPHLNHRPDEGQRGRISKPWHYTYKKRKKIIQVINIHLNHINKFFKTKEKNKRLTEVVLVTGWRGRSTAVRTGTGRH